MKRRTGRRHLDDPSFRKPLMGKRGASFDPTKLSIKDKIKHAAKPDTITVRQGRLPARNRHGYKMVRAGHNIQYRKIKGPTEAKIDKTLAKSKLLSQWKRASSAQRRAFLAGTIAAGPAAGLTAAALAGRVGRVNAKNGKPRRPDRPNLTHKLPKPGTGKPALRPAKPGTKPRQPASGVRKPIGTPRRRKK